MPHDNKREPPVLELRHGAVKAVIWRNLLPGGGEVFNTTFTRLFKDGEQWRETSSFGEGDLLALAKLADQVDTFVQDQRARDATQRQAARQRRRELEQESARATEDANI